MFRTLCFLLVVVLSTGLVLATPGELESAQLTDAEMALILGQGWCGFFDGLAGGLAVSAAVTALVPGGQGYAVGAGVSVAFIKLGTAVLC